MRRVVALLAMSADGYYLDLKRALDWQTHADEEFRQFLLDQLGQADTLVLGRIIYERVAASWPTPDSREPSTDPTAVIASIPKVVMSSTLTQANWPNTRVHPGPVDDELLHLMEQPGKGIVVLGSAMLTAALLRMGLLAELRILVNPVVTGQGRALLTGGYETGIQLRSVRQFQQGRVLLCYLAPIGPTPRMIKYPDGHVEFGGWTRRQRPGP